MAAVAAAAISTVWAGNATTGRLCQRVQQQKALTSPRGITCIRSQQLESVNRALPCLSMLLFSAVLDPYTAAAHTRPGCCVLCCAPGRTAVLCRPPARTGPSAKVAPGTHQRGTVGQPMFPTAPAHKYSPSTPRVDTLTLAAVCCPVLCRPSAPHQPRCTSASASAQGCTG